MVSAAVESSREPSILIVEDSPPLRSALRDWLAASFPRARVVQAASGEEAVALAEDLAPDVVLMDISLPQMDGLQATREIHARCPAARVVVLTIHEDTEYRDRAAAAGASAFVPKRTMRNELLPLLRAMLRPGGQGPMYPPGPPWAGRA